MKRILTICLLTCFLITGGITIEAKSTKKNSSTHAASKRNNTGTSLSLNTFIYCRTSYRGFKEYTTKNFSSVTKALKKIGFVYAGEEVDDNDKTLLCVNYVNQKTGTEVWLTRTLNYDEIIKVELEFESTSERDKFVNSFKFKQIPGNLGRYEIYYDNTNVIVCEEDGILTIECEF